MKISTWFKGSLQEGQSSDPEIKKAKWQETKCRLEPRPSRVCQNEGRAAAGLGRGARRWAYGDPCHVEEARNSPGGAREPITVTAAAAGRGPACLGSWPGPTTRPFRLWTLGKAATPGGRPLGPTPGEARFRTPGIRTGRTGRIPSKTPGCRARGVSAS